MIDNAGQPEIIVRVERILACVGASPWLESQVETVAELAKALGAETTFLHVNLRGGEPGPVRKRIERALTTHGAVAEIAVVSSRDPGGVIIHEVARRGIDLVYAGAAPHEPVLRDILGSTARRIARGARCSVLLDASPSGRGGAFPTAVVSVRMNASSRAMAGFVLGLARAGLVGTVHVVHEIEPVPHSALRGDSEGAWRITRARADAELREFVSGIDCGGVPLRTLCLESRDHAGVVDYSKKVHADLVVCHGPRRRIRIVGRLLGDEYDTVLTDLPSALLLAQTRRAPRQEQP